MAEAPKRWEGPPLEAWEAAWSPPQAAEALAGVGVPWAVAGGWAIDLWLGRQTRPHGDLEITVIATDFPAIRARLEELGLELFTPGGGEVIRLPPGEAPPVDPHQTWAADPAMQAWRIDVFREPGDVETWAYRRDPRLTAPRAFAEVETESGLRAVAPQIVLFFKAKAAREKDEADFALAAPLLADDQRGWLIEALAARHPGHPWIERLSALD
jgi:hypothetical protein